MPGRTDRRSARVQLAHALDLCAQRRDVLV